MGLEIAGMGCVDKASGRRSVSHASQPSLHATRAKLNYIRALSSKRAFHRANLLVELVPNLIAMGQSREALEEISIVITSWPFRSEPMLHLYAGLLILQLGALELPTEDVPKEEASNMRAPEVHIPPFDPERDADLLRVASHHFEGCINAGATQSTLINMERQRLQTSQKLKTKKAKRRMRSGLKKRKRGIAETDDSGEEEEEEEEEEQGEGGEGNVEDAIDINTNAARDQWAVEMARAYLDLIRTWLPRRSRSASAAESQRRLKRELIQEGLEYRERREGSSISSSSSSSSSSRTNASAPSQASSSSSRSASDASRASSDSDSSASDSDSR
ncbi:hypothetical protein CBOM_02787 [Ceraceosorus bombacis]|uniref:Uncharacterized protein n=1 Tax=Ceraceosorus bombacis TaxID=401625 RepID=A0A0N7L9X2_9BASI|nr:hypothetical protein CBOM_02787 [Ceraceosorus bombacis]